MRVSRISRKSLARIGVLAALAVCVALLPRAAAAAETTAVPFAERYRAVLHGGVTSAANSVITCGEAALPDVAPCAETQRGGGGRGGQYAMAYIDVDEDPNTYNSSRAELTLPEGSRVAHARLYWGANIRVGEQKPPEDNGRVLIAEPGGRYKAVIADSVIGHHDAGTYESYTATADVTGLVRQAGPGAYTVGQVNVAMGHSDAGGWGGWALVVAYEDDDEPLREVALLDGFETVADPGRPLGIRISDLDTRASGEASLGMVAFGGDRGVEGDTLAVNGADLSDAANPAADVMNSTISRLGEPVTARQPAHANTLGFDADVLDVSGALRSGGVAGGRLDVRFSSGQDGYQLGAVFVQADAGSTSR